MFVSPRRRPGGWQTFRILGDPGSDRGDGDLSRRARAGVCGRGRGADAGQTVLGDPLRHVCVHLFRGEHRASANRGPTAPTVECDPARSLALPLEQSPPLPVTATATAASPPAAPVTSTPRAVSDGQTRQIRPTPQGLDYRSLGGNRALQQLANPFAPRPAYEKRGLFGHFRSKTAPPPGAEPPPANVTAPPPRRRTRTRTDTRTWHASRRGGCAGYRTCAPGDSGATTPRGHAPGRRGNEPCPTGHRTRRRSGPTVPPGTTPPSGAPGSLATPGAGPAAAPATPTPAAPGSAAASTADLFGDATGTAGPGFGGTLGTAPTPFAMIGDLSPLTTHADFRNHVRRYATRPAQAPISARRLANLSLRAQFQNLGKPVAQAAGPHLFQFQLLQQYE